MKKPSMRFAIEAHHILVSTMTANAQGYIKKHGEPTKEQKQEDVLLEKIKNQGIEKVVEQGAQLWFHRLIGLWFMETRGYLPHPVLQQKLTNDVLYTAHFVKACEEIGKKMPYLFSNQAEETAVLLHLSCTQKDGVVQKLLEAFPKETFGERVEMIGQLHQCFHIQSKDKTFADLKKNIKISKEKVPTATQFFTPPWLVKYLVENTLGRIFLEEFEEAQALKKEWKYFVEEKEKNIAEKKAALRLKDLTFIDPCMGSGHMLVYAFELLMQLYLAKGYDVHDGVVSILSNNLYGIDVDDTACNLASFAVLMKACSYDVTILEEDISLNIIAITESNDIDCVLAPVLKKHKREEEKEVEKLLALFLDGKEYGSLLLPPKIDFAKAEKWRGQGEKAIEKLIKAGKMLSSTYDVVVTNPPYMGKKGMNQKLGAYLKEKYPCSKCDLFAVFIERCSEMTRKNGYCGMLTQQSFMFLKSYRALREKMLKRDFITMVHLGSKAFDEITGEVVQTTAFVQKNSNQENYEATYVRLVDFGNTTQKEEAFLQGVSRFFCKKESFLKIPHTPIAYWISPAMLRLFEKEKTICEVANAKQGMATTDTKRFLRYWYELPKSAISFHSTTIEESIQSNQKWFPINKGGAFRKWYGNNLTVVNYENNGREIKENVMSRYPYLKTPDFVVKNQEYYFRKGMTWTLVSTSRFGVRCFPSGLLFDVSAHCVFCNEGMYEYLAGYLNSNLAGKLLKMLTPTVNFPSGAIERLPIVVDFGKMEEIVKLVRENVGMAKEDWDSFELSWDFSRHPLLGRKTIEEGFARWSEQAKKRFLQTKENEEQLNAYYNHIFKVEKELSSKVEDEEITISRAEKGRDTKSLLSFAVGCLFGRYQAGEAVYNHKILAMDTIVETIAALFQEIWGTKNHGSTLAFVAEGISDGGAKKEDEIARYMAKKFYQNHVKIYCKVPIYWMFTDGTKKALVYVHTFDDLAVEELMIYFADNPAYCSGLKQIKEFSLSLDDGIKANYARVQSIVWGGEGRTLLENIL